MLKTISQEDTQVLSCAVVCVMIQCGFNVLVCGSNHAV